jgi:hypothetical protein
MDAKELVTYCEFLGMGNPIERELTYDEAMKRYKQKVEANKRFLFGSMSFIGVKDKNGKWIITNDKVEE